MSFHHWFCSFSVYLCESSLTQSEHWNRNNRLFHFFGVHHRVVSSIRTDQTDRGLNECLCLSIKESDSIHCWNALDSSQKTQPAPHGERRDQSCSHDGCHVIRCKQCLFPAARHWICWVWVGLILRSSRLTADAHMQSRSCTVEFGMFSRFEEILHEMSVTRSEDHTARLIHAHNRECSINIIHLFLLRVSGLEWWKHWRNQTDSSVLL